MPTYEYRCAKCEQHLEVYQSFSEAPLTKHKGCGGKLTKVLSAAGIVLKGSGFYKTDSRKSGASDKTTSDAKSDKSSGSSSSKSETSSSKSDSSSSSTTSSSGSPSHNAKSA